MTTFRSRTFGDVGVAADGAYVTREVALGSRAITRSLFIGMELEQGVLDRAARLVDTLETLDARARQAIQSDTRDVPAYVFFHLEELEDAVLREIFGAERKAIDRAAFVARFDLVGVGVHAREPESFALVLDYSVGRAHTDQIIAVSFDMEGRAIGLCQES